MGSVCPTEGRRVPKVLLPSSKVNCLFHAQGADAESIAIGSARQTGMALLRDLGGGLVIERRAPWPDATPATFG
jgi:hypothetical protein